MNVKQMAIKKGDFIELEYTGELKDGGVFDTTDEAKEKKIMPDFSIEKIQINLDHANKLLGLDLKENDVKKLLEKMGYNYSKNILTNEKKYIRKLKEAILAIKLEQVISKEPGEYRFELAPENAFGKKDVKLIQLIPTSKFTREKINPMPGLQINIDGHYGMIKTVSGGRTLVDFNHPLSGRDVIYQLKINRIVTDDREKAEALLKLQFNKKEMKVEMKEGTASANVGVDVPKEILDIMEKKFKEIIPGLKKLELKK